MKKLNLILSLLLFFSASVFADEVAVHPQQTANENVATIAVQKQPTTENTQTQEIKQNKWCIIIQVNGKIKGIDENVAN